MNYRDALRKAHEIEVGGDALYAALARRSRTAERRAKWLALQQLEIQTRTLVADAAASLGVELQARAADIRAGRLVAALLSPLPWGLQMRVLRGAAGQYVHTWDRMQRECANGDPAVLAELVAHEVVQVEFARDEIEGRGASSLSRIRAALRA